MVTGRRGVKALQSGLLHAQAARTSSSMAAAAVKAHMEQEEQDQASRITEVFGEADSELRVLTAEETRKLDQRHARLPAKLDKLHQRNLAHLNRRHESSLGLAHSDSAEVALGRSHERDDAMAVIESATDQAIGELARPWTAEMMPLKEQLDALEAPAEARYPEWNHDLCEQWEPPAETPQAVRIGRIAVNLNHLPGGIPKSPRLALPGHPEFQVPLALGFPQHGSLLIETTGDPAAAISAINGIALRLLASLPPGRSSFVFIDPVGLGRGFAGLMHLSDYEETLITHRIWTQTTQIEERLAELCEHIEKVIQMYLRNEYATIADYNEQAGSVAEKYRFLVIAGFPTAFSETAAKRLRSIAASGARCGVHLLIQQDRSQPVDPALDEELKRACLRVTLEHGRFRLSDPSYGTGEVTFDVPPSDEDASTLIHRIGQASIDSNRVEVPFSHIAPPVEERWSHDTSEELRVPVGRAGAKKLQMLAIGKGTRQHVLVAGKTGSGKSTLFHVIITNLALWSSPEQVEFYLVDFKKGVEFKCYGTKRLPHARVVAIESDREFALSVLQQVDHELKRRGELFRKAGSQDLASYNRQGSPLPRTLLLIDEFQEFFTEDDSVAQEASLLLDRIVRQGRAFGIHVILGSQTLGGAYTLARATLGQMVIRIALQCNEADAHLIMDEDNPAPRLLTRPGEGIYNDQAGALAANSPFQIVWLSENERDKLLGEVAELERKRAGTPAVPIVFEGNAPAEIRDNAELAAALHTRPAARPAAGRAWLGAPNSIKGPTEARFQRQSGSHLLVVGQSGERTFSLLLVSILSLASQYPAGQAEFYILDPNAAGLPSEESFQRLATTLPHKVRIGGPSEAAALMTELDATLQSRASGAPADAPEVFLIVRDLQRFKTLRPDDEFRFSMDDDASAASPSQILANVLNEGGPAGMHVIASTDTWNNVSRWVPRKLMAEFEMRVLFQMSANDSANLIDGPAASGLGLHRALFHNEHLGSDETFRPYALPDDEWLEETKEKLQG
ncbi:MAG: FtsK/SpoIIIE domain-containing protein, partial [Luteolibacter sp.]